MKQQYGIFSARQLKVSRRHVFEGVDGCGFEVAADASVDLPLCQFIKGEPQRRARREFHDPFKFPRRRFARDKAVELRQVGRPPFCFLTFQNGREPPGMFGICQKLTN